MCIGKKRNVYPNKNKPKIKKPNMKQNEYNKPKKR